MKLTKQDLTQIIMEELNKVIKENTFAERARRAEGLYEKYWSLASKAAHPESHKSEMHNYDPESEDRIAQSNVGFAESHLGHLLYEKETSGEELTEGDIIQAIHDGWEEAEFDAQDAQDYYDED